MSMLAERKQKQKWSLNPRGKAWSQDSNKFGQKMLEKMGWSQGKGLGAKEDGRTEHIKVSYKNDSQGMGYKESDDQWTEHEANFSALLAALGGGQENDTDIKLNSLEEKSQNSKARVHYKKFTRGKDLSKYSEKDLANIFGKKSLSEIKRVKKEMDKMDQEINDVVEKNKNFSNSGLMSDYFKKKLPNFGNINGYVIGNNGVLTKAGDTMTCHSNLAINQNNMQEKNTSLHESESESELRAGFGFGFKSAKSFPEEKAAFHNKEGKAKSSFVSYVNESNIHEETPPTKRKDKTKRVLQDDASNIELTPSKRKKINDDEVVSEKKKKKSKKNKLEEAGLSNPAFNPLYTPTKVEKHILEPIEENIDESLNLSLNDTVGQMAENFEVQAQIINEVTPVKGEAGGSLENVSKKKKKKRDRTNYADMSCQIEDSGNLDTTSNPFSNDAGKKKKKRKEKYDENHIQELDDISLNSTTENSLADLPTEKKKKRNKSKADSTEDVTSVSEEHYEGSKKSKSKSKKFQEGVDNPFFNIGVEHEISTAEADNPYEVKVKEKKKKNKNKNIDDLGMENPVFNGQDAENTQDILNEEYEVKRKNKSSKKSKKDKDENKGLDNPALNLNDSVEENCDLMLNVVSTPMQLQNVTEPPMSIEKIKGVARRKSVRFSDVTRERIIPSKEELESETLDESRDIVEIEGKLNDSSDLTYIDKFIQKKKAKKKNKGLENIAFDQQANNIEENISSISKTLDSYQAEIENDINEAKVKSVEMDDIMVGEVGNPDGSNEKLPDGSIKLKFKDASFRKSSKYQEILTGSKKSYKHLIKGDIVMEFKESNLHEIEGYAVIKAS